MTTDPAVTVLARTIGAAHTGNPDHECAVCRTEAADALAELRPIIEAEVRERIAADIVATATGPIGHESGLRYIRSDIAARIARGQT